MPEPTTPADVRGPGGVDVVAALADDVRRSLYLAVRAARGPVGREAAAQAVGVSRKLAAFHLDKLVAVGLLEAGTDQTSPRRVGRAAKVYSPAAGTVSVSVPARRHLELAEILVEAMSGPASGETAEAAAQRVAAGRGRALAPAATTPRAADADNALDVAAAVLAEQGYEPYRPDDATVRLHNCPFHPLAARSPEVVCRLNGAFLGGLVEAIGSPDVVVAPVEAGDECCAEIRRRR